jgi:SAM-dependent methyltransferase
VDLSYGQRYRDLYRHHWWWRVREEVILQELRRSRPEVGWGRILDIGCGDGLFFDELAHLGEVEGVEPDVRLLDPAGPWRHAIHAVPFDERFNPPHRYDLILLLDVLEHLREPEIALTHAIRLLAPRGTVLVTVPAHQWIWTRHDEINRHVRRYDRRSFRALAAASGLEVTRERYLFQWLVLAKLLVRGIEFLVPGTPGVPGIPPAPLNTLIEAVTRVEQAITARVPMPFGSSLLIAGRASS